MTPNSYSSTAQLQQTATAKIVVSPGQSLIATAAQQLPYIHLHAHMHAHMSARSYRLCCAAVAALSKTAPDLQAQQAQEQAHSYSNCCAVTASHGGDGQ